MSEKEKGQSLIDKVIGRFKKAAGEVTDDPALKREGRRDEQRGEAREELGEAEERVREKAREVAERERQETR